MANCLNHWDNASSPETNNDNDIKRIWGASPLQKGTCRFGSECRRVMTGVNPSMAYGIIGKPTTPFRGKVFRMQLSGGSAFRWKRGQIKQEKGK